MKTFIENHITWQKLAPHDRGEFLLNVEHATVIRETQALNIDIALNFIIPHEDLSVITAAFRKEIGGLRDVSYRFRYDHPVLSEDELLTLYIPHMMDSMSDLGRLRHTADTGSFLVSGDQVILYALGEQTVRSLNEIAAPAMSRMFQHDFGIRKMFVFRNKDEEYEEKIREMQDQTESELLRMQQEAERAAKAAKAAAMAEGGGSGNGFSTGGPQNGNPSKSAAMRDLLSETAS